MLAPRSRWLFPTTVAVPAELLDAGRDLGLGARVVALLAARGVTSEEDLRAFLGDAAAGLHDANRLPDAEIFRDRILAARDRREQVLVFGDFDADGITGLAILTLALRRLGVGVLPYVPSRLEEGHGLSLAAVEAARQAGAGVIVTVDTGSSSVAEVAAANAADIDVLMSKLK